MRTEWRPKTTLHGLPSQAHVRLETLCPNRRRATALSAFGPLACRVSPLPAVLAYAVTSLPPTAHSGAITSYCNRCEGEPKLSASGVGLRMTFAFHQLRIADEGRIQIARRMPKGGNGIRPAGPARPSEIIAQGSDVIRIVLAQAGTRRGGACGRDSKCAPSLNSQSRARHHAARQDWSQLHRPWGQRKATALPCLGGGNRRHDARIMALGRTGLANRGRWPAA